MTCHIFGLTHKQLEMHACIFSTVVTDALVLKNQAINIQSAEQIFIALEQFHSKHIYWEQHCEIKLLDLLVKLIEAEWRIYVSVI